MGLISWAYLFTLSFRECHLIKWNEPLNASYFIFLVFLLFVFVSIRFDMKQFCCFDWFTTLVASQCFVMFFWLKFTLIALNNGDDRHSSSKLLVASSVSMKNTFETNDSWFTFRSVEETTSFYDTLPERLDICLGKKKERYICCLQTIDEGNNYGDNKPSNWVSGRNVKLRWRRQDCTFAICLLHSPKRFTKSHLKAHRVKPEHVAYDLHRKTKKLR